MKKNKRKHLLLILIPSVFIGILLLLILLSSILPSSIFSFLQVNKESITLASESGTAKNLEIFNQINKKYPYFMEIPISIINKYYDSVGPEALLGVINQDYRCHIKGHNIGRVIYQKTQDIEGAMMICSNSCNLGCIHGVMSEVFENRVKQSVSTGDHVSAEQVKDIMADICSEVAKSSGKDNLCVHGMGHALIGLTEDDLKTALLYCDNFETPEQIFSCANGVYMQYFGERRIETGSTLTRYPCSDFSFPAACYQYKLRGFSGLMSYSDIIEFCRTITDKSERRGCFSGVGAAFSSQVQIGSILLDDLCKEEDYADRKVCVEGAMEVVQVFDHNRAAGVCFEVSDRNKVICQNEIKYGWVKRDVSDYYVRK